MHPIAASLNETLQAEAPAVFDLLSNRGRAAFFPSKGILGQAAEAKGRAINATIGIALEDDGTPMRLPALAKRIDLEPRDAFTYAPSFGKPQLRDRWRELIQSKNPSLEGVTLSRPIVTCALTHALSVAGGLFLDPDEPIYMPDLYWGNYGLIYEHVWGARITTFNTFTGGGFDVGALKAKLLEGKPGKRVLLLNFPNNPTGYTPTEAEADALRDALVEVADAGRDLVVLVDDAYFGLVYAEGVMQESIFARLADAHERLLAVKIDGATKEDYVWGFRVGFMSFAMKGVGERAWEAMESKTAGTVRATVSNAPHLSQSLLLATYDAPEYAEQKAERYATLRRRFEKLQALFAERKDLAEHFEPLPCNSGYFMCARPLQVDAEALRQHLLAKYDTGVIATKGLVRLAFSSTPYDDIEPLVGNLLAAARDLAQG